MELFLEAVAHLHQVVIGLGVLRRASALGLFPQLLQLLRLHLGQPLLAGDNVHGQLFVVLQVQLIHLVEHGDILHEHPLVLLQLPGDLVHIHLRLAVLGLHGVHLVAGLLEKAEDAALVLLLLAEVFQLHHQAGQGVSHLAQVLCAHIVQGALREAGHALLGGHAVVEHQLGVGNIDLLGKLVHLPPLRLGEHAVVDHDRLNFLLLRLGGLRLGAQGQHGGLHLGGVGVQGQLGHHVFGIAHLFVLRSLFLQSKLFVY